MVYESLVNAENVVPLDEGFAQGIAVGADAVFDLIAQAIGDGARRVALDGWYGVDWAGILAGVASRVPDVVVVAAAAAFVGADEVAVYKRAFTVTADPGFGVVNTEGRLSDLVDEDAVGRIRSAVSASAAPVIVYGPGATVPELDDLYDFRGYVDVTRQPVMRQMHAGELVPFGATDPDPGYDWKEYNYCDHYLLDRQKDRAFERMDVWIEGDALETLKLVPRAAYDRMMQSLVEMPVKQVGIYHPGPWGGYRFRDRPEVDVPGLSNNAWNLMVGAELSVLVDVGIGAVIRVPQANLLQYGDRLLGPHLTETYPKLFPLEVWLEDGYFPEAQPFERTSMPLHNHPDTGYVQRRFREPLGRFETYYIAEAYEGAATWLGFQDDADVAEWERLCRDSGNVTEIPDWQDYIARWDSAVGDLYLIPPGTTHGSGGNQTVLEMDTCASIAGTEYSFFMYDYARPTWDDTAKEMTARPSRMHLDHGFGIDKAVRASWAKDHLRARPTVVTWTPEYAMDRYSSDPRQPFVIERLHFDRRAQNDTDGRFLHILTLTVGTQVVIRSLTDPTRQTTIRRFQPAIVPACFGAYEILTTSESGSGTSTVVLLRWKTG